MGSIVLTIVVSVRAGDSGGIDLICLIKAVSSGKGQVQKTAETIEQF